MMATTRVRAGMSRSAYRQRRRRFLAAGEAGRLAGVSSGQLVTVGRVGALWRYPVKSMLGEPLGPVAVGDGGVDGDRRFGVVDARTGMVASAKRPHRWRRLLLLRSEMAGPGVIRIHFPDGRCVLSTDDIVDKLLSEFLGDEVELRSQAVLSEGAVADVEITTLEIAGASPAGTFFDFTPLQLLTSASLARAGAAHPAGRVDVVRYRPNVVIETAAGLTGFVENDWAGHRLHLGPDVIVDVLIPSPRCAVPTLPHGDLPPDPDAFRVPLQHNVVPVPLEGFGAAPCLGVTRLLWNAAGFRPATRSCWRRDGDLTHACRRWPPGLFVPRAVRGTLRDLRVGHAQDADGQHLEGTGHPERRVPGAEVADDAFWLGVGRDGPAEAVVTGLGGDQADLATVSGPVLDADVVAAAPQKVAARVTVCPREPRPLLHVDHCPGVVAPGDGPRRRAHIGHGAGPALPDAEPEVLDRDDGRLRLAEKPAGVRRLDRQQVARGVGQRPVPRPLVGERPAKRYQR
jgi:MOSC domain-containing protein